MQPLLVAILLLPVPFCQAKVLIIYFLSQSVQRIDGAAFGLEDSQDERIAFGDRDTMFEVRGQRTVCRDNSPLVR